MISFRVWRWRRGDDRHEVTLFRGLNDWRVGVLVERYEYERGVHVQVPCLALYVVDVLVIAPGWSTTIGIVFDGERDAWLLACRRVLSDGRSCPWTAVAYRGLYGSASHMAAGPQATRHHREPHG